MKYGILKSSTNTGNDSELQCVFAAPLSVVSNQPAFTQDMMSLKRLTASQNVQRWEIEAALEPSNSEPNFLVQSVTSGYHNEFYVRMPQVYGLKFTSVPTSLTANAAVYASSIQASDTLVAGEFIQIAGDSKVYLVTSVAGNQASIYPKLQKAATAGVSLITGLNVTLRVKYDNSVKLGIIYTDGILSNPGTVKLLESL